MGHYLNKNKPALGDAFKSEDAKEFLKSILKELQDAHRLKHFLTVGHKQYYKDKINELSNHFYILEVDTVNKNDSSSYKKVKRCIDGTIFSIGDKVIDKLDPNGRVLPIGQMYDDELGLLIRLDYKPDGKSFTWRHLSHIEHDLPF